jgi:hypothetical protein
MTAIDIYKIPKDNLSLLEEELRWAKGIFEQIEFLNKEFILIHIRASFLKRGEN